MRNKLMLSAILAIAAMNSLAQSPEDVQRIFPGNEVVYLNYKVELKISMKSGMPVAEEFIEKDIIIMNEKNASAYSRHRIYHSSFGELRDLEAYTKVPDGSKFKKVKVSDQETTSSHSNNVFYDDVKETSFDFPALTKNAIQHVQYSLYHKDAHLISPFRLPGGLPIVNGSYSVIVPNDVSIKYAVKNDTKGALTFTMDKRKKETVYTWTCTNYKGEDDYSNAPDERYYQPHVIVYIGAFEGKDGQERFLDNLDDLYKWNAGFTTDLNTSPDENLKRIVDSLVKGKKTEEEKARVIYKWVQQNIKYVAFENGLEGFRPRQAAQVCTVRYGDCKDMASIITQMLRMAGIKGYYTWIGTRDIPYDYTDLPLPIVDNHMISTAFINNEWIFLDATNSHGEYGIPPSSIQGKEALVGLNDKEYKVLRVPVIAEEKNMIVDSTFIQFTPDGVKGSQTVDYSGYFGEDVYLTLLYRDEKGAKDYVKSRMSKGSNKFILGEYSVNKTRPEANKINIKADFEIPGYGKKLGDEYFINLNLEKLFENRVIDTSKRKVPVEEEFKYKIRQYHVLEIPKGYQLAYHPADFEFSNDLVTLKIAYQKSAGKVVAYQELTNKKLMIHPKDFSDWNKAAKAAATQYKEQIVLEKIK